MKSNVILLILFVGIGLCVTENSTINDALKADKNLRRRDVHIEVFDANNKLCRYTDNVPKSDSYKITAKGLELLSCNAEIRDKELLILRIGERLSPGENLQVISATFTINIDYTTKPYSCYVINNLDDDNDIFIHYIKDNGVTPKLDIMLTETECIKSNDSPRDCEINCRVDSCTFTHAMPQCKQFCIDKDFNCDGYQHCPYGEDESCGEVTTVTPGPTSTPDTTTTVQPPSTSTQKPVPPHIRKVLIDPNSEACTSDKASFQITETVLTSEFVWNWKGSCTYKFYDHHRGPDDEYTLVRFSGKLKNGEQISINNQHLFDHNSVDGECVVAKGSFVVKYATISSIFYDWMLTMTPIDCDDDDLDDCDQTCYINECRRLYSGDNTCKGRVCIDDNNKCDGIEQCPRGEDEDCGNPGSPNVYKEIFNANNDLCRYSQYMPDYKSYNFLASGLDLLSCNAHIKDKKMLILRIGERLNSGENLQVITATYPINIDYTTKPYSCYVINNLDDDNDIFIHYIKDNGVTPKLNVMLSEAECVQYDEDSEDCEINCRVDSCTFTHAMPQCKQFCIDKDFNCDGYQHCPYGEDESCGEVTTVTPGPTSTPSTTSTIQPPWSSTQKPVPSHINKITINPITCVFDGMSYRITETVLTSDFAWYWKGVCSYSFVDIGTDPRYEYTLVRLSGKLTNGEHISVDGIHTFDRNSPAEECIILKGNFFIAYGTESLITTNWMLVITPLDCEDSDLNYCGQSCYTDNCHKVFTDVNKCKAGCIGRDNICDGIGQCPLGEDEDCYNKKHSTRVIIGIIVAALCAIICAVAVGLIVRSRQKKRDTDTILNVINSGNVEYTSTYPSANSTKYAYEDDFKREQENIYETA